MGDFFVAQMDDLFTEGVCFDTPKRGKGERRFGAPPFSAKGRAKGQSSVTWAPWELRLMGETGAPSMEDVAGVLSNVCPPPPR